MNSKDLMLHVRPRLPLCLLILIYFSVRSIYWNCRPIWDGAVYFDGLLRANEQPFDLLNYSVDGHICQGFYLVMSLGYFLFKSDYYLFNIWLTLFGTLSIIAFYRLLNFFSQGRVGNVELALVTALFAFHPSILASMIHFNLDIGVITFFLWYWVLLLEEHTILAAILGALLILSKETAMLLLPLPFLFSWLMQPKQTRPVWLRRHWWAGWTPYCTLVGVALLKMSRNQPLFWNQYNDSSPMVTLLKAVIPDKMLVSYLGLIFVMNFNWLLTLLCFGLMIAWYRKRPVSNAGKPISLTMLLWLLFACALVIVLLVRPYAVVRYCIVLTPIALVGIARLAMVIVQNRSVRIVASILLLLLLGMEDFRTIDPLSKMFFGTFQFGNHEMLSVNRRNSDWTSVPTGIDHLVYNLEFLKLVQLSDHILLDLHPEPDTFVLCRPFANWHFLPRLDKATLEPSFDLEKSFLPQYTDFLPPDKDYEIDLIYNVAGRTFQLNQLPTELNYIVFPTFDNEPQIRNLSQRYNQSEYKTYVINGYSMSVIHFTSR